jgi:DNA-binding protein HU-beta
MNVNTKAGIANGLRAKTGMTVPASFDVYDALGRIFSDAIRGGEEINLFGLAKIKVIERKARAGRNPRTGETVQVPAKRALKITVLQPGKEALGQ